MPGTRDTGRPKQQLVPTLFVSGDGNITLSTKKWQVLIYISFGYNLCTVYSTVCSMRPWGCRRARR